jgi:acyl-CoA synthetase (AMP-forming)/AMP-acid ligase II
MIFHSPYPNVIIPEIPLTPFVLRQAGDLATKPALVDGITGRILSYKQLADDIHRAAVGLSRCGLRKGDVLAIYSPNLPEYAVAFHAVAVLGGVITTVSPLHTADELAQQLRDSGAAYLITVSPLAEKARTAAAKTKLREVFIFGEADGMISFASLLEDHQQPPEVTIDPRKDLVTLLYSSGTSGLPKGVMHTHYSTMAGISVLLAADPYHEQDTLIGVAPFSHILGLWAVLNAGLASGATIVTIPRFDLEQFLQLVQQYRITRAGIAPPIVQALAKHPLVDHYDLSSLKALLSGGAPLGEETMSTCAKRLGCAVRKGYGLTEVAPVAHLTSAYGSHLSSVGVCMPNTECKGVDPVTGQEQGPNEPGEIWVRGPQMMKGYLNQPAATAQAIDGQGWLHTGDIGYVDPDGYLYIVDRLKEIIKYKGYQVAPAELEAVLMSHPMIADAAVIPSPDEEAGEVPKAFVVLRGEETPEEIVRWVNERVAAYKRIRRLEIIKEIPKSPSGKILRRILIQHERKQVRVRS